MESIRKPFQGVWNIIRFNWHFYMLAILLVLCLIFLNAFLYSPYTIIGYTICFLLVAIIVTSLLVSFYIYDLSGLYRLNWLTEISVTQKSTIVNINAGFDELSPLLQYKFPDANLVVFDFYDPLKHTEVSIKRARRAYPPFKNTVQVNTGDLPLQDNSVDNIFVIFSAHEIRDEQERIDFFIQLNRILKYNGKIVVVEHLRDVPNFLAYNLGFFHFISKSSWYNTFKNSGLSIYSETKITPFITNFILEKNGTKS